MSKFVGVIRSAETGQIYAVVNPDSDSELDNPRFLLLRHRHKTESIEMVKVPRDQYMGAMTTEQLVALVERLKS